METFKTSLISYLKDGGEGSNRDVMNKVGNKVFQAIIAYSEQMFDEAARLLLPVSGNVFFAQINLNENSSPDIFNIQLIG